VTADSLVAVVVAQVVEQALFPVALALCKQTPLTQLAQVVAVHSKTTELETVETV
jgi:hypothetical protein